MRIELLEDMIGLALASFVVGLWFYLAYLSFTRECTTTWFGVCV